MSNPFAAPAAPGEGIKWGDIQGSLLIVEPISQESGIQTSFGEADAVRARVSVVDGPQGGTVYDDTLIFPKLLQSQTRPHIGGKVLGRLTTGTAKPGQSPPWLLDEATPEDQQAGVQFLQQREAQQVSQPAPAQGQPQPQPAPAQGQQPQQQWQQPAQGQPAQQGGNVPF